MFDAVKEKPYATDFMVMVGDAIKIAVELPGHQVFGAFEFEMLVGHEREDVIRRQGIFYVIDGYFLGAIEVVNDRVDRLFSPVEYTSSFEGGVVDAKAKHSPGRFVYEYSFHTYLVGDPGNSLQLL
jgi:hypothetical protein